MYELMELTQTVSGSSEKTTDYLKRYAYLPYSNYYLSGSIYLETQHEEALNERLQELRDQWLADTRIVSSSHQIFDSPSYQKIIGFGWEALPFIISDLKQNDNHWFQALSEITGEDPIQPEHYGFINLMKEDWLSWADEHLEEL